MDVAMMAMMAMPQYGQFLCKVHFLAGSMPLKIEFLLQPI
jgi:hypothetical protein